MIDEEIKFYFSLYKFTLRFEDQLKLFTYPGNILRGAVGSVLKEICCINKRTKECSECLIRSNCVYVYLFESYPEEILPNFGATKDLPRPFVLEVDHTKNIYQPQEEFNFNLILFGKATQYIPYFILTLENLSTKGIGSKKNRAKFKLVEVKDFFNKVIYKEKILKIPEAKITYQYILSQTKPQTLRNEITLNFLSPTRIKEKGLVIKKPQFLTLFRAMYRRILAISYFYCGQKLNFEYKMLTTQAKNIIIKKENLQWYNFKRYSKKQKSKMNLGGFIGPVTYQGESDILQLFLPFLVIGQYTHIGKNCTFGLGRYEVKY